MAEKFDLILRNNLLHHQQLSMVLEQYRPVLLKHQLLLLVIGVSVINKLHLID
jgi:hypothetical protein